MPDFVVVCHSCATEWRSDAPIGRSARCDGCGADLRVCRNCAFFEEGAYNDCREPSAERVTDKTAANFCDFFRPSSAQAAATSSGSGAAIDDLEALFRK